MQKITSIKLLALALMIASLTAKLDLTTQNAERK